MASTLVAPQPSEHELSVEGLATPLASEKKTAQTFSLVANKVRNGCRSGVDFVMRHAAQVYRPSAEFVARHTKPLYEKFAGTPSERLMQEIQFLRKELYEARIQYGSWTTDKDLPPHAKEWPAKIDRLFQEHTAACRAETNVGSERYLATHEAKKAALNAEEERREAENACYE